MPQYSKIVDGCNGDGATTYIIVRRTNNSAVQTVQCIVRSQVRFFGVLGNARSMGAVFLGARFWCGHCCCCFLSVARAGLFGPQKKKLLKPQNPVFFGPDMAPH